MKTCFESELVHVKYDSLKNIIIVTWITPPTSEEFREGMSAVLQAIKDLRTGKVVWDCTGLGAISPVDQEWTVHNFHNPGVKYGYSEAAIVLPEDIFTKMAVGSIVDEVGDFKTKYFDSTPAAIEWILQ
jgi:hypothetical protein